MTHHAIRNTLYTGRMTDHVFTLIQNRGQCRIRQDCAMMTLQR